jgi:drug/metabolite transporter (DMT)-like permease
MPGFQALLAHSTIALTVLFTVLGQLAIKHGVTRAGAPPLGTVPKIAFVARLFFDPFVFFGFVAAFLASLAWIGAMTKFELSYAYPFTVFSYVLILFFGVFFLHESLTPAKIIGTALVIAGIAVLAR